MSADGWSSNRWDRRDDPARGRVPTATVVVPAYGNQRRLEAVLEALAAQDHTGEWEVLIVDDGTDPPLDPAIPDGLSARVVRQERRGFGLARARHLGALRSDGEVLCFLDSDILPARGWLAAHLAAHEHDWVLGCGPRRHVDTTEVDPGDVRGVDGIADLFEGQAYSEPAWLDRLWKRTDRGRRSSEVIWRATSGGNQSVARGLYFAAGGYEPEAFTKWGGEDNDFGYRVYQSGGYVLPVDDAVAWHLGRGTSGSEFAEARLREVRFQLASRIPDPALSWPRHVIPRMPAAVIEVSAMGETGARVRECIVELLASFGPRELGVGLAIGEGHDDAGFLCDLFGGDSRVHVGRPLDRWPWTRTRVRARHLGLDADDLRRLLESVGEAGAARGTLVDRSGRVLAEADDVRALRQLAHGVGSSSLPGSRRLLSV